MASLHIIYDSTDRLSGIPTEAMRQMRLSGVVIALADPIQPDQIKKLVDSMGTVLLEQIAKEAL